MSCRIKMFPSSCVSSVLSTLKCSNLLIVQCIVLSAALHLLVVFAPLLLVNCIKVWMRNKQKNVIFPQCQLSWMKSMSKANSPVNHHFMNLFAYCTGLCSGEELSIFLIFCMNLIFPTKNGFQIYIHWRMCSESKKTKNTRACRPILSPVGYICS